MYMKIIYGWFAEENRGKTADLDKALQQDCVDEFAFFKQRLVLKWQRVKGVWNLKPKSPL